MIQNSLNLNIDELRNELKRDEGAVKHNGRHVVYFDHLGNPTIGYGRLIREGGGLTDEEADMLLDNDIKRVMAEMDDKMLWWRGESDMRKRALVNMAFNLGVNGLLKFKKALYAMQHGLYKEATAHFKDSVWFKQVPNRVNRLCAMIEKGYNS